MPAKEKKEHGLSVDEDIRRFDAIVVDGTAAGILGNLPKFFRETKLLTCAKEVRLKPRLITTPGHVKALKNLLNHFRAAIKFEMSKTRRRSPKIFTDLIPERTTTTGFTELHIKYLRMFIDEHPCFCDV